MKLVVNIVKLEIGFNEWGLISTEDNEKYYPINFPEQLKMEGKEIVILVRERSDVMTSIAWGKPIEIISFPTI